MLLLRVSENSGRLFLFNKHRRWNHLYFSLFFSFIDSFTLFLSFTLTALFYSWVWAVSLDVIQRTTHIGALLLLLLLLLPLLLIQWTMYHRHAHHVQINPPLYAHPVIVPFIPHKNHDLKYTLTVPTLIVFDVCPPVNYQLHSKTWHRSYHPLNHSRFH